MSKFSRRQGIAAVLVWIFLPVATASNPGVPVHIRLVDRAGLPVKLRSEAEAAALAIFRKAGVTLEFVQYSAAPGPKDFVLQILNLRPKHLVSDAIGSAVLVASPQPGDSYAAIWLPEVESAALSLQASVASVLAVSMAHEIGHLLLHSPHHSYNGVMSPRINRRQILLLERGELLFTPVESARLKAL